MKRICIALLFISLWQLSYSQNLQEVLKLNNKALGLSERKKISNLETTGYLIMRDSDSKIPFKIVQSKPDLLRIETTVFGFKAIQTYDGITAWLLSPTQGLEAKQTDSRDMEFIAAATAIEGPFSVNKDNKYTLKYLGKDEYLNKDVEVVMWDSEFERLKYYIDSGTHYFNGIRYEYKKNGGWNSMEYRIKSYLDYEGSKFPDEITAIVNGVEMISLFVTRLGSIEKLDKKVFGKPSFGM